MSTPTKMLKALTPAEVMIILDLLEREEKKAEELGIDLTDGFKILKNNIERTKDYLNLYDLINQS
jgi:hypothetical protein